MVEYNDNGIIAKYLIYRIKDMRTGNDEYYYLDDVNRMLKPINLSAQDNANTPKFIPNETIILQGNYNSGEAV